MKNTNLLILLLCACVPAWSQQPSQKTIDDFKKLNWLEGTWTRINAKPGKSGVEEWKRVGEREFTGRGIAMKGMDTAFVEKLRIVIKDNVICYVADVPENKSLVYFKFTELTNTGFVCENAAHDFPKKISYKLEGKKLTAIISGGDKSINYIFERR